jgi:hypothetical protein
MKKFIGLSLIALLIVGFSATAYAQIDFKTYGMFAFGFLESRNVVGGNAPITQNYDPNVGTFNDWQAFMSSYANIFFEWSAGKDVRGVFNIETCNYHAGTNTINRRTQLGPGGIPLTQVAQGAEFDTGLWNTRVGQTRLRTAYVQFGVPYFGIPVPMTISAGIIPMAVRPLFLFALTEGAGIQVDMKYDPVSFSFYWGKMVEGKTAISDDSDHYSGEARVSLGPVTVGGYLLYQNMNTYPIDYNDTAYGLPSSNYSAGIWWGGMYADGKLGPINFNADLAIDYGKVEGRHNFSIYEDVKYRGWAGQLKLTYPWEKFTFGGTVLYASGADRDETDQFGLPGNITGNGTLSDRVTSWVFPAGSNQWVPWAESMFLGGHFSSLICIPQGLQAGNWLIQANRGATGGTWVAKLSAAAQVTPWYRVTLWGLYIGDTTENGNSLGNARKSSGALRDDGEIGIEFSLIQDIKIYKNLTWSLGAGILFAGDALDQYNTVTGSNDNMKNPVMLSTALVYNF